MAAPDFVSFNAEKLDLAIMEAWHEAIETATSESRFLEPQTTFQDIPRAIRAFVDRKLASLARELNESNAVKLPAEIITEVLLHLPFTDRATASRVSHDWEAAFKTSPHIWREASCDDTQESAMAMTKVVELSGNTSLDMNVSISVANQEVVLGTLSLALERCRSLHLFFNSDYGWPDIDKVMNTIATEAPRLTAFGIHDTVPPHLDHGFGQGIKLLGGSTNNLIRVEIDCDLTALDAVDTTAFAKVSTALVSQHGNMTPDCLRRIFQLLPAIESLIIRIEDWQDPEGGENLKPITPPASLGSLDLVANSSATSLLPMFNHLNWQDVFRVSFETEGHPYTSSNLAAFFSGGRRVAGGDSGHISLHTAWIDWYDEATTLDIGLSVFLTDSNLDPYVLIPRGWHGRPLSVAVMERSAFRVTVQLPDSTCANITKLYLHELAFDSVALPLALPEFPAVTHLAILLMNTHFHRNDLGVSPFIAHATDDTLWFGLYDDTGDTGSEVRGYHFPKLSTLWIAAGHDDMSHGDYRPTMTPAMVLEFVTKHLQYGVSRIEALVFFGINMYVEPGNRGAEEFDQMLSLAQNVAWDDRTLTWAINYDLIRAHMGD